MSPVKRRAFAVYRERRETMTDLILKEEAHAITGDCFEVYRELGCGFLEAVFQEAPTEELILSKIPFVAQERLPISYKGKVLQQKYIADFICFGTVIVEIKAVEKITDEHRARRINYLRATGKKLGFLVNFGAYPKATVERIVATQARFAPHD